MLVFTKLPVYQLLDQNISYLGNVKGSAWVLSFLKGFCLDASLNGKPTIVGSNMHKGFLKRDKLKDSQEVSFKVRNNK